MHAHVICSSTWGVTRGAAQDIALLLSADVEELSPRSSPTRSRGDDLEAFDIVVVGASIANDDSVEVVRRFLESQRDRISRVAFFFIRARHERADLVAKSWARACRKMPLESIVLDAIDIEEGRVPGELYRLVAEVKRAFAANESAVPSASHTSHA